jgi:molecular chaperone Hsp33
MARWVTEDHLAISLVRCTDTVRTIAAEQYGLSGGALRYFGDAIAASLLLATRLKGPGLLTFELSCTGAFDFVRCDAIGLGSIRGMIPESTWKTLTEWNGVDVLDGPGQLRVTRRIEGAEQPYVSTLALEAGSVLLAANRYLTLSDQVDGMCHLDIRCNEDGSLREAVGIYLERLPGGTDEDLALSHLRRHQEALAAGEAQGLAGDDDDHGLLERLLPGCKLVHLRDYDVGFHCPCSKERFRNTLSGFPNNQLQELAVDGVIETTCDFCHTVYRIPLDEVI